MSFVVTLHNPDQLSADSALDLVLRATKKRLGDLTIFDLVFRDGESPIAPAQGLYFFFNAQAEPLYVGKNSSMSFVERVPWHFGLEEGNWMNHFVKRLRSRYKFATLADAARFARDCGLVLMPIHDEPGGTIERLEKFFRIFLLPVLNAYSEGYRRRYRGIDLRAPLAAVLNSL